MEKRDVPSGIRPCPWVERMAGQRFVLGDMQNMQALDLVGVEGIGEKEHFSMLYIHTLAHLHADAHTYM